jgi:dihydropteroate synthase
MNRSIKFEDFKFELGKKTYIMGILNVTPDSFSDGGEHDTLETAVEHGIRMGELGADIIDIGGESTRPGSDEVVELEEMKRVIPVIERLSRIIDIPISIDTYKAAVARKAIESGASIINDVWGMQRDPEMATVAAEFDVPVIAMHNQITRDYDKDIIESMEDFFNETVERAKKAGMDLNYLILDPGIGFGKTTDQNIEVMSRLEEICDIGYPVLLGTSRKSMIGNILDLPVDQRVEGTIATSVIGVQAGVDFIRVHDITENIRAVKVADAIYRR